MTNATITKLRRIPSHMGDTIMQEDTLADDGSIESREIVMFVAELTSEQKAA